MTAPSQAKISGAVLLDHHRAMVELLGVEAMANVVASLSPPMREEYLGLLPVSWCSTDTSRAVLIAAANAAGQSPHDFQRKVVRIGIERTVRTMWRPFMRVVTDEALLKRTPLLYAKTFNRGEMAVVFATARAEFYLTGWPAIPVTEADGLAAGIETVLELSGRKDTSVTWDRIADGAHFIATWIPA